MQSTNLFHINKDFYIICILFYLLTLVTSGLLLPPFLNLLIVAQLIRSTKWKRYYYHYFYPESPVLFTGAHTNTYLQVSERGASSEQVAGSGRQPASILSASKESVCVLSVMSGKWPNVIPSPNHTRWLRQGSLRSSYWTSTLRNYRNFGRPKRSYKVCAVYCCCCFVLITNVLVCCFCVLVFIFL